MGQAIYYCGVQNRQNKNANEQNKNANGQRH
jgi:hypothetical protein